MDKLVLADKGGYVRFPVVLAVVVFGGGLL